jgi:APA family basic amino acid/polyamine antiporter
MGVWDKKSLEDLQAVSPEGSHQLKRTLGPGQLIIFGIGVVIGAGLFSVTGMAAAHHAGPAIILSFLFAAIGCAFAGLCYSELVSMIPVCGSAYTYAYLTMGELMAWVIGWNLILEYAIGASAVSISWSGYLVSLLHEFNIHLPAELVASSWQQVRLADGTLAYGYINLPALAIVVAASLLLIKGMRESVWATTGVVVLKVAIIIVFILFGFHYIDPANYHPFIPENTGAFGDFGWSGIWRAAGIVFFAYIGFEAISTAAQEVVNPQKNIPIGILGTLAISTLLYVLFSAVMLGLANYTELGVSAPVAVAVAKTPYWWLNWLIKLAILGGLTSVIIVLLMGQSRIFYAMSRDKLLPPMFSHIHPRFHTPWRSNQLLMVFVGLLGAFMPLEVVGNMTSIGTLFAFVIVCLGVLILRYREPDLPRAFRVPYSPLIPILGIVTCSILMLSLELETWLRLIVWLAIGFIVYFTYSRQSVRS